MSAPLTVMSAGRQQIATYAFVTHCHPEGGLMLLLRLAAVQSMFRTRCDWLRKVRLFASQRQGDGCLAASRNFSVSSGAAVDGDGDDDATPPSGDGTHRRKRRRHRFHVESVPSFHDFQQQQRTRGLYRQYLRLVWHTAHRDDFLAQIRHEFRSVAAADDWQRKRALSEGSRRLKELSAMLGTSVSARKSSTGGGDELSQDAMPEPPNRAPPSTSEVWPWQRQEEGSLPHEPVAFPPKAR